MHLDTTINLSTLIVVGAQVVAFVVVWTRMDMRIQWLEREQKIRLQTDLARDLKLQELELALAGKASRRWSDSDR